MRDIGLILSVIVFFALSAFLIIGLEKLKD